MQQSDLEKLVHENGPIVLDWIGETLAWRPLEMRDIYIALPNDVPVERLNEQQFASRLAEALLVAYRKAGGISRIARSTNGAATIRNIATLEATAIYRATLDRSAADGE